MRAMILAAGLGLRLRPLSLLRPKPALPVRGLPVIAYLLHWLRHHGVTEVIVNTHHLPHVLSDAVRSWTPPGLEVSFSAERQLLGTGGGIRSAADFLRESDPSLVVAGDGILDLDLAPLLARHRARRDLATLVLRRDSRAAHFGTIGLDGEARVRRIGQRFDLGGESAAGVFLGVRLFSRRALDRLPTEDAFEDLSDWLAPLLAGGADDVRAERLGEDESTWEPVGTPAQYLQVNLKPAPLSFLDAEALATARGTQLMPDLVLGSGASLGPGAVLTRAVVWDGEQVPAGLQASDGVFAGGTFHDCGSAGA